MTQQTLSNILLNNHCDLSISEITHILQESPYHCFFIKDENSNYVYANDNFIFLMGLSNIKQLRTSTDEEMSQNKKDAKKYRDLDCQVLDSHKSIEVSEVVSPEYNQSVIKTMSGTLRPIFSESGKTKYVMGLVAPESKLIRLNWDAVFSLDATEISELLTKRSYDIILPFGCIRLSRMEISCLIELVKGKHAGEIAQTLGLKQSTIESYLANIKNKCGVFNKSELINLLITQKVFEQVMV